MLDEAGLRRLKIVARGRLNETRIDALVKAGAPIDIFGVGTEMSVAADAPALENCGTGGGLTYSSIRGIWKIPLSGE